MQPRMNRRRFLKGLGFSLALPMLESFKTPVALAASASAFVQAKRLFCIGTYLGFHRDHFFPKQTGKTYELPYVLEPLDPFRDQFSIFSGLDHRGRNGHEGWKAWMSGYASGSVSMDQLIAAHVGHRTRYSSLQVTCGSPQDDARVSYTKEGMGLPMIGRHSSAKQHWRQIG